MRLMTNTSLRVTRHVKGTPTRSDPSEADAAAEWGISDAE